MIITNATLAALRTNFYGDFQRGFGEAQTFYQMFCMEMGSTTKINTYGWMDRIPKMREWVGPRVLNNLKELATSIVNKDWESTVVVPRNDIEDDNLGVYPVLMQELGRQARRQPDLLFRDVLEGANAALCFDGQFFFDTDHPVDFHDSSKGTQSNLFTSTALSAANFNTVLSTMKKLKGADGEVIGGFRDPKTTYLVVPPELKKTADEIVVARTVGTGGQNVQADSAVVVEIPELTSPTTWYLISGGNSIKPFVFQNRKPAEFRMLAEGSEREMLTKEYVYGADCRNNVGLGLYWFAARCTA